MPMITINYASPVARPGLKAKIAAAALKASTDILHKDPKVTAVLVEEAAAEDWFCEGKSLTGHQLAGIWLEIRVTEGTNTVDEKAEFVAAIFEVMRALLGSLHPVSYVLVLDVRADAYGYGGVTQERRQATNKFKAANKFDVPRKVFAAGQVLT